MVSLAFSLNKRDPELTSFLISLFTWSKCFHCELIFSDKKVLRCDNKGIYWTEAIHPYYLWTVLPLPTITTEQEQSMREKAEQLVASKAKYDWTGAILGSFSPYFNSPERWFCSELCAYLLTDALPMIFTDPKKYWTPGNLWKAIGAYLSQQGVYNEYTCSR